MGKTLLGIAVIICGIFILIAIGMFIQKLCEHIEDFKNQTKTEIFKIIWEDFYLFITFLAIIYLAYIIGDNFL